MKIRLWSVASVGILAAVLCFSGWTSAASGRVTNSLGIEFVWMEPGEYLLFCFWKNGDVPSPMETA